MKIRRASSLPARGVRLSALERLRFWPLAALLGATVHSAVMDPRWRGAEGVGGGGLITRAPFVCAPPGLRGWRVNPETRYVNTY